MQNTSDDNVPQSPVSAEVVLLLQPEDVQHAYLQLQVYYYYLSIPVISPPSPTVNLPL